MSVEKKASEEPVPSAGVAAKQSRADAPASESIAADLPSGAATAA